MSENRRKNVIIIFLTLNIIGLVGFIILGRNGIQSTWQVPSGERKLLTINIRQALTNFGKNEQGHSRQYAEIMKPLDLLSEYVSSNFTIANNHWGAFKQERGWVELSHAYAQQREMSPGLYLPDNPRMGLFILDGYHQMHCLVSVFQRPR
jgi:hypothetical protein